MHYHDYGSVKKIPFKITLNGVGVSVTLAAGDVKLSKDGAAPANVGTLPSEVDATNATGMYEFTPTAAEAQATDYFTILVKDQTATIEFDENMITHYTGGHASARFAG